MSVSKSFQEDSGGELSSPRTTEELPGMRSTLPPLRHNSSNLTARSYTDETDLSLVDNEKSDACKRADNDDIHDISEGQPRSVLVHENDHHHHDYHVHFRASPEVRAASTNSADDNLNREDHG